MALDCLIWKYWVPNSRFWVLRPHFECLNHISNAQISNWYFAIIIHLSTNMFHNCIFFSKYWVPTSQKFQILSTQITFQALKFQISILQLSFTWVLTCFTIASFFSKYWVPTSKKFQILSTQITFQALKFQIDILQLSFTWVLTCLTIASFF